MARKTVRVEIPRTNPDPMLTLIAAINKKHKDMGNGSPLDKEDSDALKTIISQAQPERDKAKDFESKAQSHNQTARGFLGINEGQSSDTPGTGLYHTIQVRDTLLKKYKGSEETLSEWGFNVVVGSAKSPKPRKPKA